MKNGRDKDYGDPKITSLSAARKEKAANEKKKARLGLVGERSDGAQRGIGEWLFGALIIVMAVGFLLHVSKPLWQGGLAFAP